MKKILVFSFLVFLLTGCKKTGFSPKGPTDIRVYNDSDIAFTEVVVNTSEGINTMGDVAAKGYSEYFRFDMAYPKAEITAKVNGVEFSTGSVNYLGLTYIGQAKITYKVWIKDMANRKLDLEVVYPIDGPLD